MKESTLTTNILKALRAEGGWWFKVHGGPFQQAGVPDIVGVFDGVFFGVEVKLPGRPHPVTKLQRYTLHRIHAARGVAVVVESVQDALDAISAPVYVARAKGLETFELIQSD